MYTTIKINNTVQFEEIQGVLSREVITIIENRLNRELLEGETITINANILAQELAKNHTAILTNGQASFCETDSLNNEEHRVFVNTNGYTQKELVDGFNNGTILFGEPVCENTVITVETY